MIMIMNSFEYNIYSLYDSLYSLATSNIAHEMNNQKGNEFNQ